MCPPTLVGREKDCGRKVSPGGRSVGDCLIHHAPAEFTFLGESGKNRFGAERRGEREGSRQGRGGRVKAEMLFFRSSASWRGKRSRERINQSG